MRRAHAYIPAAAALVLLVIPAARADDPDSDGPGRGVARISVVNGDVSVRRGDSGDWVAAAVNAPLVVQDRLATGAASRAEIQFDYANMLRLASNSEVRLSELEYRRYQIQVARGTVTYRVLRDSDADVEVSTPSVSVRPSKKGMYRISVRDDGLTEVTVRSGEVEVYTPRGVERLRSGKTMLIRGTSSEPEFQVVRAAEEDDWDVWNERRDRDLERSRSYRYVHRDIYGADDLDAYGAWIYVPPYGWVWRPYVNAGWAPYRLGRWAWLDWYGWNWVSYDPWGWAPYHYGRWFYSGGWCWWPGVYRHPHYYYRPALVAFFGWGGYSGIHVGIGFGNVGWVPLAPYEPYHPWYGRHYYGGFRSGNYINNSINITNVNITNIYRNARVRDGITAVGADDFVSGRTGRFVPVDRQHIERAGLVRGALPVTPSQDSLRYSDRQVRQAGLARSSDDGRFFSRRQPASVDRVPFEQQRRGMEEMSRRAVGGQTGERTAEGPIPRGGETARQDRAAGSGQAAGAERGWRRVGEPSAGGADRVRSDPAGGESGWRRFGEPAGRSSMSETGRAARDSAGPGATGRINRESGADRNWRRFGEPSGASPDRGTVRNESAGDSGRSWRRFGDATPPDAGARTGGRTNDVQPQDRGAGRDPGSRIGRESTDRWQRFEPSPDSGRGGGMDRSSGGRSPESIRINPPLVRERSAPRMERSEPFGRSPDFRSDPGGGGRVFRGETGGRISGGGSMPRGDAGMSRGGGGVSRSGGEGAGRVGGGGGRGGRSR